MRHPPRPPRLLVALAAGALAAAGVVGPSLARADAGRFKVVVNEACPASALTREEVSRLFLGKAAEWPGGTRAEPVDQPEASAIRAAFTRTVHRRSVAAVKLLWQAAIFSGRAIPPPEASGDAAVLAYVRSHPGAIGYVSAGSLTEGVRVLPVED